MALFRRIWASLIFFNFVVLFVFVGLAAVQFGNINAQLVGERLAVLAERTAAPFESAARLGLPLSMVRNADALLERARQTDDTIQDIHVFDTSGKIIHSTALSPPSSIPAGVLAVQDRTENVSWHSEIPSGFVGSKNIAFPDGGSAGGILIMYPGDSSLTNELAMMSELAFSGIGILALVAALGSFLLRISLAKQIRLFEEIEQDVRTFETSAWRNAAGRPWPAAESDSGELLASLKQTEDTYRAAGKLLPLTTRDQS